MQIHTKAQIVVFFGVCVDALYPSQQFFSHVGIISHLPGLNQYQAEDKMFNSVGNPRDYLTWNMEFVQIKCKEEPILSSSSCRDNETK